MPTIKSEKETKLLLESRKGGANKPILFATEIEGLKKNESLMITLAEFPLKTSIPAYYYAKYSKGKEVKTLSISKVEGGYLLTKI
ncbi:hypothetical protein ABIB62_002476 [Mucilaginibacter sp. UYP25]|uniref:hypothetical protein n=1 Tax=unclassified Mucilaginibacter TaxID=2617802 RepID=UPI0033980454